MVCCFFGHADAPNMIYPMLFETIEKLIVERDVAKFVVGNHGGFDGMVRQALGELKTRYPHISANVVLAYMPLAKPGIPLEGDIPTILPEGIEQVSKRYAITWRNKWMVRESQIVVCYVTHSWGGAAQFVESASKLGKEIINLAQQGVEKTKEK